MFGVPSIEERIKQAQRNAEVYKSELDYLYDDNENNVDKANNENNETEIIEAEEVDTGKIDWD